MPYPEFARLLGGINDKTPLGNVIKIRSEDDPEILKHFTKDQQRIRDTWRREHPLGADLSPEQQAIIEKEIEQMFAGMFAG